MLCHLILDHAIIVPDNDDAIRKSQGCVYGIIEY